LKPDSSGDDLGVRARVSLQFEDEAACRRALQALAPENETVLQAHIRGSTLELVVKEARLRSVLATLDDAVSCLQAAKASERAAGQPP
jgi:hypothetical protein